MEELKARLSLDSSQFDSTLSSTEARVANYSNRLGSLSQQGERAFDGPSRSLARFAGSLEGVNRYTFLAFNGLSEALERSGGDFTKFGQIIGSTALYAGAIIGLVKIISYAKELSEEIDKLNAQSGQKQEGFLGNLYSGYLDLVDPKRMTSGFSDRPDSEEFKKAAKEQAGSLAKSAFQSLAKPSEQDDLTKFIRDTVDKTGHLPSAADILSQAKEVKETRGQEKLGDIKEQYDQLLMEPQQRLDRLTKLISESGNRILSGEKGQDLIDDQEKFYRLAIERFHLQEQLNKEKARELELSQRASQQEERRISTLQSELSRTQFENNLSTMPIDKQKESLKQLVDMLELAAFQLDLFGAREKALETQIDAEKYLKQLDELDKKSEGHERLRALTDQLKTIGGTVGESGGVFGNRFGNAYHALGDPHPDHITSFNKHISNTAMIQFDHQAQTARNTGQIVQLLKQGNNRRSNKKPPIGVY